MDKTAAYKNISLQVKDMDMSKGQVQMYVSAFGNVDAHGDVMMKGAYKKTIAENIKRIVHLYQHRTDKLIGRPELMVEDNTGLLVTGFVSDISNGDYRKMYEQELIQEHSVGFIPIIEEYNSEEEINYIKEVKLFEYSSVTWGANPNTPVVKSMDKQTKTNYLFDNLTRLEKAFRNGSYTDETFKLLEIDMINIKSQIKALISNEPQTSTQKTNEPLPELVDIYNKLKSKNSE